MSRREEWAELLEGAVWGGFNLLAVGGFLGGAGVLAYQIFDWLKKGEWLPVPVWRLFEVMRSDLSFILEIEWRGLQKILLWLLDLPLSIVLCVLGILLPLGLVALVFPIIESIRPPPKQRRDQPRRGDESV